MWDKEEVKSYQEKLNNISSTLEDLMFQISNAEGNLDNLSLDSEVLECKDEAGTIHRFGAVGVYTNHFEEKLVLTVKELRALADLAELQEYVLQKGGNTFYEEVFEEHKSELMCDKSKRLSMEEVLSSFDNLYEEDHF